MAASTLFGLSADAPVDDIEFVLGDVRESLKRVDSKRDILQEQIAVASHGKRRASRKKKAAAVAPGDGDHGTEYTRKGAAGVVRRRLRDAAGGAKKERKRLEAVCGDLEEALVDAKESMALQRGGTAK